jgi:hypothetical protein
MSIFFCITSKFCNDYSIGLREVEREEEREGRKRKLASRNAADAMSRLRAWRERSELGTRAQERRETRFRK